MRGPDALASAVRVLRDGGLVAFPTETVYGLGADATNERAVARVFEAKGRPRFDPLIVHVASWAAAAPYVAEPPPVAGELAARFWPGPLTLVLKKRGIPDLVTAGRPTVAIRVPAHPLAQALLARFGGPVAAPSANPFGAVSPTRAEHVAEQLGDRVDLILDGGPCAVGVESTILGLFRSPPVLLRPGGVPQEELEPLTGPLEIPAPHELTTEAPGRQSSHYAPRTPVVLLDHGARHAGVGRVGLLAFTRAPHAGGYAAVEVLSPSGDLAEAARRLFAALRKLDALGLDRIEAEPVPEVGLGRAIQDRLRRAAARDK